MDNAELKHYHDEEFDPSGFYKQYIGSNKEFVDDTVEDIMESTYQIFSSGSVKGDTLIDASFGIITFHLFVAADYFKNITLIESSDSTIEATKKWLNKHGDSVEKSHIAAYACSLKKKSTGWKEQEEITKNAIKQILKLDFTSEIPLGSVVYSQADCLISIGYLEISCPDQISYLKILNQFSSLLRTGGHLILFIFLNISYYMIGELKFSALKCDEEFVRKSLTDTGFTIKSFDKIKRKVVCPLTDWDYLGCVVACKEN
ncbi:hypothetical protein GDO86_014811 [Hymenochirus boettgeri]|uniref:Uncharacterized protein n=1 Tax=Hymenochirus boettgeri TaxID=247094 RepID=A0A8T2JVP8_9PIPI|nr:hypothetical protein GDO86_014811 [Hymenochirus boettgeri]